MDSNGVRVNGEKVYLTSRVDAGQVVAIELPSETSETVPEAMNLDIRYEDEEVIVINKLQGVLAHPTARERTGSLLAGVRHYLLPTGSIPHCVHRLDRDTSGVVMFAKHAHTHHLFDISLRAGKMHRAYLALVYCPELPTRPVRADGFMTVDLPIGQDPNHPSKRIIEQTGQPAVTHFRIVERIGKVALVQLQLETGRTHQIRIHMASIGLPLIGDRDYTMALFKEPIPTTANSYRQMLGRQALHAFQLSWMHAITDKIVHVTAPIAEDMRDLWCELGGSDSIFESILQASIEPW